MTRAHRNVLLVGIYCSSGRCSGLGLGLCFGLWLGACGGGSDASPDAAVTRDAASVQGAWAVASQTVGGVTTPAAALDGTLVVGATDFAFATAEPLGGLLASYTLSGDGRSFVLAGGPTVPFTLDATPQITLAVAADRTVVVAPDHAAPKATFSVAGTVTAPSTTAGYTAPTVLIAFLSRDQTGFVNDYPPYYQAITFTGATASFDFELGLPVGLERIVFGPSSVAVAMGFIVVFDNGSAEGPPKLDDLFTPCGASTTTDCVLGMAPILLAYRQGTSTELTASPFAYLKDASWSQAIIVTDARGGGTKSGLVSLDVGKVLPFDIALWADPSANTVPRLDLTVPAKR